MRKTLILLALTFLSINLSAQQYLWNIQGGCFTQMGTSSYWNKVLEITSDFDGNTYILAQSGTSQMQIADIPLTGYAQVNDQSGSSQFNLVLASFTPEGENRWVKVIGGRYNTWGYTLQTDDLGHVYLSGRVYPTQLSADNTPIHFDTDTILPQGVAMNEHKKIMYMAQYDTEGNFNWLHMPEPDTVTHAGPWLNNSFPNKADVDPESGDVYWHCMLREGQFDWEGDNIITEESDYILKYNTVGEVTGRIKLDMKSAGPGSFGDKSLVYLERDHDTGIFYISGTQISTYYPLIIGGDTIVDRLFAASFSPSGELLWLKKGDNDIALNGLYDNNTIYDMKLEDGYLYFTGTLASGSTFGEHVFDQAQETACSPFIMKLASDGNMEWAHISATSYNSYSKSLAIRGDEVAITGQTGPISWPGTNSTDALTRYNKNAHISRFDKISGDLIKLDSVSTINGVIDTQEIYAPRDCDYYLGGAHSYRLLLGQDTLWQYSSSERTFFMGRYSFGPDVAFTYEPFGDGGSFVFNAISDADTITWDFGDGSASQTGESISHTFSEEGQYQVCATTSGDCESEYCVTVEYLITGIRELTDEFKIYPNPAIGEIRIDGLDQSATYSLYSHNGVAVKQGRVTPSKSIDISRLSNGMYVLHLKMADGKEARMKVLKQRK